MSNIAEFLSDILAARYGKDVRQSIHDAIEEVDRVADTAQNSATASAKAAEKSAKSAAESEGKAAVSAGEAAESAKNAAESAERAAGSVEAVEESARNAAESEKNAKASAGAAAESAKNAAVSEKSAATSAGAASESAKDAAVSAESAERSAEVAKEAEKNAETSAENAGVSATAAESYARGGTGTRENEEVDNAKYYKEQAERIAEGLKGSLLPMGTIPFAELPENPKTGYMYNISDEFVTTDRFKEGAGNTIPAGTNVYYTADGFWDCMAGNPVTGVKGEKEDTYRRGNVSITAQDVGALPENGDSADNTVTFVSLDSETPTIWTDVEVLRSGEKHGLLLNKISSMFKNVRWLHSQMGELKKSVSDGKKKVASAITAQGVSTAADATFDTMAANITAAGTARYNAGRTQGRKDVTSSPNTYNLYTKAQYDANYSKGVTAADNRANPNSVNYKTGYNAGYAAGQNAVKIIRKEVAKQVTCHTGGGEGSPRIELVTFDMDFPHGVVGLENYWVDGQGQKFGIHGFDISGNRITLHLGNTISWFDATITLRAMIVGY